MPVKIVITDYPKVLERDLDYEVALLQEHLPEAEIQIVEYREQEEWLEKVKGASGILTAFLNIDGSVMDKLPELKCISVNASGYNTIAVEEAAGRNIKVAAIQEYCTQEVAEHTMMLMLALTRGVKHYTHDIDVEKRWQYTSLSGVRRIEGQTLGICGYGKIGRAVAKRARAFGMNVIAYSPSISEDQARQYGIELVDKETLLRRSDVISNHMAQSAANYHFFDAVAFQRMEKSPVFINVGRGSAVDEVALCEALDKGYISAAGLDVLDSENPILEGNPLVGRENVIITPHAAFYSEDSMKALQEISCMNLIHVLKGEYEQVHRIVNEL